jgi:hypothetical protein
MAENGENCREIAEKWGIPAEIAEFPVSLLPKSADDEVLWAQNWLFFFI